MVTKRTKYFNNNRRPVLLSTNYNKFMARKLRMITATGGNPVADNQNSITAGPRGLLRMRDYELLEKLGRQNRGRIPARLAAPAGTFSSDSTLTLRVTMQNLYKAFYTSAAFLWLSSTFSGMAATTTVSVQNDKFVPSISSINAGDSVVWHWDGSDHNVTSTSHPAAWTASATVTSTTFTFTNTFNTAGTFPYECTIHVTEGMLATINVAAALSPPTVSITNPVSGALFPAPASVTMGAATTDASGTVTNVQFLVGSTVFSNRTNNLPAGSYTLSAIATDNNGLKATNTVSIQVFTPISLGSGAKSSATGFQFSYPANSGLNYVVQRSTDLNDWISLSTNTATANPTIFTDGHATNNSAFYRVGLLPNP
jgi:plastocyanin